MVNNRIDWTILDAGCLIYAADRNFGGEPLTRLDAFFGGEKGLQELTLRGAIAAMSLYQDDGYNVRVVFNEELTEAEKTEWTSRASSKLNLESGILVISGVIPDDDELSDFEDAENGGEYELGCFVDVPAGEYRIDVYGYPPGDLAGGWMRLENPRLFRECFGADGAANFEKPIDYFNRTRTGEAPPAWLVEGYEQADFLGFLIHLTPLTKDLPEPKFEPDGCLAWHYRKPEICPVGIRLE